MLFGKCFSDEKPDKMLQGLFYSKSKSDNRDKLVMIQKNFDYTANRATQMPSSADKSELAKILEIVNKILDFNFKKINKDKD